MCLDYVLLAIGSRHNDYRQKRACAERYGLVVALPCRQRVAASGRAAPCEPVLHAIGKVVLQHRRVNRDKQVSTDANCNRHGRQARRNIAQTL